MTDHRKNHYNIFNVEKKWYEYIIIGWTESGPIIEVHEHKFNFCQRKITQKNKNGLKVRIIKSGYHTDEVV